jgi:hypothetical protein
MTISVSAEDEGLELGVLDPPGIVQLEIEGQGVPAGDRADLTDPVVIGDHADVARVQEVILHLVRVFPHVCLR